MKEIGPRGRVPGAPLDPPIMIIALFAQFIFDFSDNGIQVNFTLHQ